jgi:toxin FitB
MKFLIDTNVISEISKPRPDARVQQWASLKLEGAFMSAISIGEIIKGIVRLAPGRRRTALEHWLATIHSSTFQERLIPIDEVIAAEWGKLSVATRRTLPCADSLLASTARVYDFTIATRNVKDFADLGVRLFNPWIA